MTNSTTSTRSLMNWQRRSLRAALCAAVSLPLPGVLGAQASPPPLEFGKPEVVGRDALLAQIMDIKLGDDGSVFVLDFVNFNVVKFDPTGRLLWRAGQKGGGPGEYQLPYRIVPLADGGVLVYDAARSNFTRLTPEGRYKSVHELSSRVTIDNVIRLPDGGLAMTGVIESPDLREQAIHIFDSKFQHVRSFGPQPAIRNRALLTHWGTGGLTLGAGDVLIYGRRYPYEIYKYGLDGTQRALIRSQLPVVGTPDLAFTVIEDGSRVTTRATNNATRFRRVIELGDGRLVGGRHSAGPATLDVFRADGTVAGSMDWPANWSGGLHYDRARNVIWVASSVDDEPVLLRVPLAGGRR